MVQSSTNTVENIQDFTKTREKYLNILLVDDNEVNIIIAKTILQKMGHFVCSADNGKEAIETIKGKDFDLVFMDIQMPVMNGVDATIAIRNGLSGIRNINIPIAAMTANTSQEARKKYIESGMNGIVSKPISFDSIYKLIKEIF